MTEPITTPRSWQNRIVGHGEEAPDQLLANPKNWRIHPGIQQAGLEAVLDRVGWVQSVVVNRRTGFLVDGHLRVTLAMRRSEPVIPVVYVDLDEEEEALILATIDPLSGLAGTDHELLDQLLAEIKPDDPGIQALLDSLGGVSIPPPPDLNNLGDQHGEHDPAMFWPVFKVKLKPEVYERWESMSKEFPGDDAAKFEAILERVVLA
jgi:hypothetical protein